VLIVRELNKIWNERARKMHDKNNFKNYDSPSNKVFSPLTKALKDGCFRKSYLLKLKLDILSKQGKENKVEDNTSEDEQ
jgi:hypothetical protein